MSLSLGTLILIIKLNQYKVAVDYPLSIFQIIQLAIKLLKSNGCLVGYLISRTKGSGVQSLSSPALVLTIKLQSQSSDGPVLVQVSTPITFAFWDVQENII